MYNLLRLGDDDVQINNSSAPSRRGSTSRDAAPLLLRLPSTPPPLHPSTPPSLVVRLPLFILHSSLFIARKLVLPFIVSILTIESDLVWSDLIKSFSGQQDASPSIPNNPMSKKPPMATPRLFLVRHGETEWSLSGKHTGRTDIPLTADGEKRVRATGQALVGDDRLIVPHKLAHIYVSPRKRAQRTFELMNLGISGDLPWRAHGASEPNRLQCRAGVQVTEDVREWDYGEYEGITSPEIRTIRADAGIEGTWDIWRDGCPGGESPDQVTARLDRLIAEIRQKWHKPVLGKSEAEHVHGDVLIVAHGHILRALALRWAGKSLQDGPAFLLEAGGVGTLSYEHHSIDEPAIMLGSAFAVGVQGN
ncbi:hypothetical protein EsDP_00003551 [Epichloe bromicola]|uniref:Phosphoglycerate mutase family protein n=1 Tax=Epichloe bromicola TaxID=79588 RepID=A0ABQ0CP51_9HYPO